VVAGGLLMAAGAGWIAAVAAPGTSYLALVVPMVIIGVGLALSIPAVTRSVTSMVPPADLGTASGAFSTMRQLGGAFGVAVIGAVFAAAGSYATAAAFSRGFVAACWTAAGLALVGAVVGAILPGRPDRRSPAAPAQENNVGEDAIPAPSDAR
jgi:MFS family permease